MAGKGEIPCNFYSIGVLMYNSDATIKIFIWNSDKSKVFNQDNQVLIFWRSGYQKYFIID